uniref:Uncharacterized protein n=1 Tax=Strigamia maritima TaxID=126957 RepID=T1ING6_STRMM
MQRTSGRDDEPPHEIKIERVTQHSNYQSPHSPHNGRSSGHTVTYHREDVRKQSYSSYDIHEQILIASDDSLSDKEIYPRQETTIGQKNVSSK